MAQVIQIELDTSVETDQLETYLEQVEAVYDIVTEVVTEFGPAGGAPVVRYIGETPKIEQMVFEEFTQPGLSHLERLHEVVFLVHGEE